MPRYLIARTFEIDEEAVPEVGRRSKEIAKPVASTLSPDSP
jgi:hypothetical protein